MSDKKESEKRKFDWIKFLYIYAISGISLLIFVFSFGNIITNLLYFVFDLEEISSNWEKRKMISSSVISFISGILFIYHWFFVRKKAEEDKK